jgi:hypothetical protein
MALVVAGVLIVRADIDLGFTALAASLLNGGFLLGVVMAPVMSRLLVSPLPNRRRFGREGRRPDQKPSRL